MTDNKNDEGSAKRKLKQASENIWYALATIAGEPKSSGDKAIIDKNRYYWNGYMRYVYSAYDTVWFEEKKSFFVDADELETSEIEFIEKKLKKNKFDINEIESAFRFYAIFDYVELPYINFSEFIFPFFVSFSNTTFSDRAIFNEVKFLEGVSFSNAKFTDCLFLDSAIFANPTDFHGVSIKSIAEFRNAEFLIDVDFSKSKFYASACFDKTIFRGTANFRFAEFFDQLSFKRAKFKHFPPELFNANVSDDISWTNSEFPKISGASRTHADFHKDAYERLGLIMDKLNKHHEKHMFFRLEMRARRRMETLPLARFINWGYEYLSDYGYGIKRAFLFWCSNIFVGMLLLLLGQDLEPEWSWQGAKNIGGYVSDALATSFSNAHWFLGLGRGPLKDSVEFYKNSPDLLIPYNMTAFFQITFGAIFLFFVLLCMRNRFRMG